MRQELMEKIRSNKEWHDYLRREPSWYRLLSRDPYQIEAFERASLQFYKKTFPDRISRLNDSLQMASALMYMMQSQFSQPAPQPEETAEPAEQPAETNENEQ
ncbi:YlbE-like family protein [Bacillus badius]|uniref:YlbE-like protein n=1 Tax=Bacillus badius TaxID=1455 RepID=A0ABR5B1F8_BACBA|nr:YlbE-like family protein [Bacillus badius]KIL73452.1 hypothetical protein SD78_3640 [Bacillus badius]KIL80461.1 hypothetical protein SD77_0309 [Bacillus badius]KZO01560.1 hypothetical protein A4244_00305 [Bacillus badius]KZR57272.1 hypothetical protein A3781_03650 [Bacillus badius]MED0667206.1 YlbE-like family protein [Bacillus badius]